jgi:hypothetical protein
MEEMIGSLVLYSLMLIVVVWSIGKWKTINSLLVKLGVQKTNLIKEIWNGLLYFGVLFLVSIIIEDIMFYAGFQQDIAQMTKILTQANVGELLIVLTIASFVEEIFFRGYLQRKTNLLFASFIFSYFHVIYGSLSEMVGAFFLGLVLGKEYQKTNNLFAPILSHFLYNLTVIVLMFGL